MARSQPGYLFSVERDSSRPGFVDVALVRHEPPRGLAGRLHLRPPSDGLVLFHHTFRPMLELAALESYAAELARVAEHASNGTFGCFVDTSSDGGAVRVTLYERWFDGHRLRCNELAQRTFDPADDTALVKSAEFVAELEDWAGRRNDEREAVFVSASVDDSARAEQLADQKSAADELAQILASETT